jgi:hypothetical protein
MEGSFADGANNHGLKRSRWRGLWRQQIQSWIIAAVQNLRLLLRRLVKEPSPAAVNVQVKLSSVIKISGKLFDRGPARLQALGILWLQVQFLERCQLEFVKKCSLQAH